MAGQPITRAAKDKLTKIESEVFDRLRAGETVTALCAELSIDRTSFYSWKNECPDRRALFREVREQAADAYADESIAIPDAARSIEGLTAAEASIIREQANGRRWMAQALSPTYNPKIQIEAGDSFGELFVQMLQETNKSPAGELGRNASASDKLRAADAEPVEADYTIEDEENDNGE